MAFKVIGGDLGTNVQTSSLFGSFMLRKSTGVFSSETIPLNDSLQSVDIVTEENKKSLLGAAGWGAVGSLFLGPLGLVAGLLSGGNKKEVCFIGTLVDGRRFMATADMKTFQKLSSLAMSPKGMVYQLQQEPQLQQTQPTPQIPQNIVEAEVVGETRQLESSVEHDGFCTNCGSPIKANWKFCPKCAAKNENL